jgi:NADPH:quinone reductase
MQAVHLEKAGGPLVVRTIPVPSPEKGEVLIKIAASPVNPSDLARIKNLSAGEEFLTFLPGIEGSGKVVAAGKGLLPALWLGKRVACSSLSPSSGTWNA